MQFLRSVATTTAIAATALPAAFAFSSLSLASSSSYSPTTSSSIPPSSISKSLDFHSLSPKPILSPNRLGLVKSFASAPTAVLMETRNSQSQNGELLPDLLTEFMVDMTCEGCVDAVKNKLETVEGVKRVDVDLSNQVVRILGTTPVKAITDALEKSGRKARLIGQGVPEDFLVSAAVAEFKGPDVFGVVRIAQVTMELARIEANFSGLSPGKHGWSINEYGDLTKGAASTGKVYNPMTSGDENEDRTRVFNGPYKTRGERDLGKFSWKDPSDVPSQCEPLGDLGTVDVDDKGEAFFSGVKLRLKTPDLIGRAIVVYGTEDKSDAGLTAAVIARSAGAGENYKKICTCDGTTIWEATNSDFDAGKRA